METLKRIESPQFIYVWQDKHGEVEIKLVQHGLKFRLEGRKIMSHECPGFFISSSRKLQAFEVWSGWMEGPTMSTFIQPTQQVITPASSIQKGSMGSRQTVQMQLDALRHPIFFTYEVHSRLRVLKTGRSHAAWFYLAASHAATSSRLLDYLSGLQTQCNRNGRKSESSSLPVVGLISHTMLNPKQLFRSSKAFPCRTYYPLQLKRMETVEWPVNLPSITRITTQDGFALIVEKLIQDSEQLMGLRHTGMHRKSPM
jgi:hypothetical protein